MLSWPNACKCVCLHMVTTGLQASLTHQNSTHRKQWWREGSYRPDVKLLASQGVRKCTNEGEKCWKCMCVYVCETHPHIWSHLCWRCSLVDRCRRSYQRCWCTLLRHTRRGWCCIHRYLKHTNTQLRHKNLRVHHVAGYICRVRPAPAQKRFFSAFRTSLFGKTQ